MKPNRIQQQIAAAERRAQKSERHMALMLAHAERKQILSQWEAAWDMWAAADCVGPEPLHPDVVTQRQHQRKLARS